MEEQTEWLLFTISVCLNQVDPFLCLVGDHKLQVIKKEADHPKNVFGSKEDDRLALKFLSEIEITQDQTRESFASEIVNSLENLSDVLLCEPYKHFDMLSISIIFTYLVMYSL